MANPGYIDLATGALSDGEAWIAIASDEPAGSVVNITFTSSTDGTVTDWCQYLDLFVLIYARSGRTGVQHEGMRSYVNDVNATDSYAYQAYDATQTGGTVSASSGQATDAHVGTFPGGSADSDIFGICTIRYFDINSSKRKGMQMVNGCDLNGQGEIRTGFRTYKGQEPITSLKYQDGLPANFPVGTRFHLFGLLPRMVNP